MDVKPDRDRPASGKAASAKGRKEAAGKKAEPPKLPVVAIPTVLIVDASREDRDLIASIALGEGCVVHTFEKAVGLMEAFQQHRPHLVFLDKGLKHINVLEIVRQCQAFNAALVLQGEFVNTREIQLAVKMGITDLLTKPMTAVNVTPKILNTLAYVKDVLKRKVDFHGPDDEASSLAMQEKITKLMEKTVDVMALPQVASRIIQLCSLQTTSADDLNKAASIDASISSLLLKRANSVAYGTTIRVNSLRDAVVRLGYRTVRSIATLISVFKLADASEKSFCFNRLGHWVHSLAVGVMAELLADKTRAGGAEDFFLAGVLHDFGKLILDDYLHEHYTEVVKRVGQKRISMREAEAEVFGVTHDKIGAQIAARWKLPETIVEAIAGHHDREKILAVDDVSRTVLPGFIHAADQMAKALMIGNSGDGYGLPLNRSVCEGYGIDKLMNRDTAVAVFHRVKELIEWINIPLEKTGLEKPSEPNGKHVCIVDGGRPDLLLDLFFASHGYDIRRFGDGWEAGVVPDWVLYDFREGLPEGTANLTGVPSPVFGAIALRAAGQELPPFVPRNTVSITAPLDYFNLMLAVAGKLSEVAPTLPEDVHKH
ncbi:MAG: response regulator [Lentisphaerae bacterium]|nr:response regulator [Lentisphaerota bacterium]